VTRGRIFHLADGMRSWDGAAVSGFPRFQALDKGADLPSLLLKAMNLEKGAWRFYSELKGRLSEAPLAEVFERLADTEVLHARLIYPHWSGSQEKALPFHTLFDRLAGDVLEGGQELSDALSAVMEETEAPCLRLLELAMAMEVAAFDLYRTMAERVAGAARTVFLSLAQAEKAHIRALIGGLAHCPA
jgi:rubrerythrin